MARRMDDDSALYFGPFPQSSAVKLVLKTLRRVFPFQSVTNHPKRVCLYNHLGLCPCPPVFDSPQLQKNYRYSIRSLIRILEGKSRLVIKELEKKMKEKSKEENYEEAARLKEQIAALSVITQPVRKPFEYDINPNLRSDIRLGELAELEQILRLHGLQVDHLSRIECYDISNFQGTHATGSLVVLTEGEIDRSQYRKFKIKQDGKPNDFAMMQEMLERRLRHDDWESPKLIVVDGGKGQLSSVLHAMEKMDRRFPVIGLAKREETIIIPTQQQFFNRELASKKSRFTKHNTQNLDVYEKARERNMHENNFIDISLPKDSRSLHLIQRIRDEAHRFAITYHRHLRSKATMSK